jgi:hypothetical protein
MLGSVGAVDMDFRLLGPLEADDGRRCSARGREAASAPCRAAVERNRTISRDQLIDDIWGEEAAPGEILVSRTVTDLFAGSDLRFEDRGEHRLEGLEASWGLCWPSRRFLITGPLPRPYRR